MNRALLAISEVDFRRSRVEFAGSSCEQALALMIISNLKESELPELIRGVVAVSWPDRYFAAAPFTVDILKFRLLINFKLK